MTIKNVVFKEAFKAIQSGVSSGQPISALYGENDLFPNAFHQMLAVGEETGSMDEMLAATALYYEEEFDLSVDQLTEMLEPIMIVFMGITVGFIIVAMYMPIFQIGDNI
jgi:type IV pilus assembly protein PilC